MHLCCNGLKKELTDGVLSFGIRRSGNSSRHLVSGPGEYAVCSFVGV